MTVMVERCLCLRACTSTAVPHVMEQASKKCGTALLRMGLTLMLPANYQQLQSIAPSLHWLCQKREA